MTAASVSQRVAGLMASSASLFAFFGDSAWARRRDEPGIVDFALGNPHEEPLPAFVDALQRWSVPRTKDWFAYKLSEPAAREAAAAGLRERRDEPFAAEDICLTNGAFAALTVAVTAVADPGDEVIFLSPPWFFYEAILLATGVTPIRVKVRADDFDLDVEAIAAAITPRTRAVIVNSPNNPTGKVYPAATLQRLATALSEASARQGRPIYLLSDEAYNRIVFDGKPFPSPASFYPHTLVLYTYGKTLLTPGQRLGYIALPPPMPQADRELLRQAIFIAQFFAVGFAFPNALLQHALPDLERISIDVAHVQRKRDRLVGALREIGYAVHPPEGTFYLMPRSPLADDLAFVDLLAARDVFVLPGSLIELPGYFRLSLTANDAMIERSLPAFAAAWAEANAAGAVVST